MLIYLDTSHLAILAEARQLDPNGYQAFCRLWRARGCALAISQVHAREFRRYANRRKRRARFAMVADLLPVYTDIVILPGPFPDLQPLIKREVLGTLLERGVLGVTSEWPADANVGLPQILTIPADVEAVRSGLESWRVKLVLWLMHKAEHVGAEATQLGAQASRRDVTSTKQTRIRLEDLGDARPTPEQRSAVLGQLEANVRRSSWSWGIAWSLLPRAARERAFAQVREQIDHFFNRAEQAGAERAYAEIVGADSDRAARRRFIDDLRSDHLVRQAAIEMLSVDLRLADKEQAAVIARHLTLAHAPGEWLRERAHRRLLDGRPTFTVNDARDLDHLAYLPWVDVFFSDAATSEYARQALGSADTPADLRDVQPPIKVPRSLSALSKALAAAV